MNCIVTAGPTYESLDNVRRLDLAPDALRQQGLTARLGAEDLGDVVPPDRYLDTDRPTGRPRNEADVMGYSHALARRAMSASCETLPRSSGMISSTIFFASSDGTPSVASSTKAS